MTSALTQHKGIPRSDWSTTLGALCDRFGGEIQTGPFGSQLHASDYSEDGTPVVMPQDLVNAQIVCDRIARVPGRMVRHLSRHALRFGDVVFSRRGDVTRFAVVTHEQEGWLCGTGCIRIRLNCPDVYIPYFRHYLQQESVGRWLIHEAKGVTMPNLNTDIVRALPFVYPPLEEQRRIAAILDQAEALRAKRRQALAKLDTLTQSLFREMFGSKNWARRRLQDVCARPDDIRCGPFGTQLSKSEFRHAGIPLWGIKHVNANFAIRTLEFLSREKAQALSNYILQSGDIVMTRKGTVGNSAVYPEHEAEGVMHSDLLRVRVDPSICNPHFLAHQLHTSQEIEWQVGLLSGGAVMPGINVGRLKAIEIELPPLQLQNEFARRTQAMRTKRALYVSSEAKMKDLSLSLQHRAFRGEL